MKMLNAALIIALTLTSGVALAERGSGEDNRIVFPGSTSTQLDSETRHYSFSNFKHRNRQATAALAKRGSSTSTTQHDSEARHFSPSDLPERNAK